MSADIESLLFSGKLARPSTVVMETGVDSPNHHAITHKVALTTRGMAIYVYLVINDKNGTTLIHNWKWSKFMNVTRLKAKFENILNQHFSFRLWTSLLI